LKTGVDPLHTMAKLPVRGCANAERMREVAKKSRGV
jgi:hypothetical protein